MEIEKFSNIKVFFIGAGNDIHTVRWVNELSEKGLEVHLIYCKDHSPKADKISEKVILHSLKFKSPIGYYLNIFELRKLYRSINPSVINAHYASGYGTLVRLSNCGPCILSVWGSDVYEFPYRSKYAMNLIKKNLEYPDRITSTSEIMAEQISKLVNKKKTEIEVIPFGVDLDLFHRTNPYKMNKKIKIGIVKKLKENYGIHNIIQAFDIVDKKIKDMDYDYEITLDIYGEGPQEQDLSNLINTLKLDSKIKLRGYIMNTEVPKIIEGFDIYVLGSNRESFGVSAVEALAMGVPIVSTDAEGLKEVLGNGEYGMLVPKGNIEKMAEVIFELIQDYEMRKTLSSKGRKHVKKLYDWNDNVDRMTSLYKSIVRY